MSDIREKNCFGELSLLFQSKRTASVRTIETCHVIVITAQSFNKYVREPMLKKLTSIIQFYRSLSFFDTMETSTLVILASRTFITKVKSNTLIVRQGYKYGHVSFIRRGRVRVLRDLEIVEMPPGVPITIENYKDLY
jgi:Cyclic nucleotide-binding domain